MQRRALRETVVVLVLVVRTAQWQRYGTVEKEADQHSSL